MTTIGYQPACRFCGSMPGEGCVPGCEAQALADVRTLDAYSVERKTAFPIWPVCRMDGSFEVVVKPGTSFVGSTADEVRGRFAAWVRGMK